MRIVYVRSYFSSFKTFYDYVEEALIRAGHEVYPFDYKSYPLPEIVRQHSNFLQNISVSKINKDFVNLVNSKKPDMLFFSHGFTIEKSTILKLKKKHNLVTINWICDYPSEFDLAVKHAPVFDYIFVSGTDALKRLRLAGHENTHLMFFACDPNYHKPVELSPEEREKYSTEISFVGSMYPGRLRFFEKIADFNISIWGPRWDKIPPGSPVRHLVKGDSLDVNEWVKVYSATKIALNNVSSFASYVDNMMNTRVFEIMACRAFQLVDTRDDIFMLFTSGTDLVCYSNVEELRKLFNYYLNHPDEIREIAENGYRKVIKEHTYDNRIKEIMEIVS
jgi:spore maturation protein CgeB